jgi:hypothetical protein
MACKRSGVSNPHDTARPRCLTRFLRRSAARGRRAAELRGACGDLDAGPVAIVAIAACRRTRRSGGSLARQAVAVPTLNPAARLANVSPLPRQVRTRRACCPGLGFRHSEPIGIRWWRAAPARWRSGRRSGRQHRLWRPPCGVTSGRPRRSSRRAAWMSLTPRCRQLGPVAPVLLQHRFHRRDRPTKGGTLPANTHRQRLPTGSARSPSSSRPGCGGRR